MRPLRWFRRRHAVSRRFEPLSQVEGEPTAGAGPGAEDAGAGPGARPASGVGAEDADAVADLRARVAALHAALDRQSAYLLTVQRNLPKERDEARADERQRVLVAVRALRRLAADSTIDPATDSATASQAVDGFARVEAAVARLDSPWTAGRPVPALPTGAPASVARPQVADMSRDTVVRESRPSPGGAHAQPS